jgi:hypothetical protein
MTSTLTMEFDNEIMAGATGLEPATFGVTGQTDIASLTVGAATIAMPTPLAMRLLVRINPPPRADVGFRTKAEVTGNV